MRCLQILQQDMWGVEPTDQCDWDTLRAEIAKYGVRNSLLLAPMPTASTAQILGNNESIEPYTSNVYTRNVLSGNFQVRFYFLTVLYFSQSKLHIKAFRMVILREEKRKPDFRGQYSPCCLDLCKTNLHILYMAIISVMRQVCAV